MKSYKQLVENIGIFRLEESLENPDTLQKIADAIKSKYGFEVSASKSTLGGGEPTYFLKVFGPKETWTNNIAMNSPFHVMFRIDSGTLEMSTNSYQVRNAKAKMRKTKYKNDADLEKKLMDYFSKNKSKIDAILNEDSSASYVNENKLGLLNALSVGQKRLLKMVDKKWTNVKFDLRTGMGEDMYKAIYSLKGRGFIEVGEKDDKYPIAVVKLKLTNEGSKLVNENLEEASDYTINHKTFSSAVQHAWSVAEKRGYEVDEDDWDEKVSLGPRKPSKGKTNSYSIDLMKKGKPVKQKLHMQVYYDEGRYELNMYIQ